MGRARCALLLMLALLAAGELRADIGVAVNRTAVCNGDVTFTVDFRPRAKRRATFTEVASESGEAETVAVGYVSGLPGGITLTSGGTASITLPGGLLHGLDGTNLVIGFGEFDKEFADTIKTSLDTVLEARGEFLLRYLELKGSLDELRRSEVKLVEGLAGKLRAFRSAKAADRGSIESAQEAFERDLHKLLDLRKKAEDELALLREKLMITEVALLLIVSGDGDVTPALGSAVEYCSVVKPHPWNRWDEQAKDYLVLDPHRGGKPDVPGQYVLRTHVNPRPGKPGLGSLAVHIGTTRDGAVFSARALVLGPSTKEPGRFASATFVLGDANTKVPAGTVHSYVATPTVAEYPDDPATREVLPPKPGLVAGVRWEVVLADGGDRCSDLAVAVPGFELSDDGLTFKHAHLRIHDSTTQPVVRVFYEGLRHHRIAWDEGDNLPREAAADHTFLFASAQNGAIATGIPASFFNKEDPARPFELLPPGGQRHRVVGLDAEDILPPKSAFDVGRRGEAAAVWLAFTEGTEEDELNSSRAYSTPVASREAGRPTDLKIVDRTVYFVSVSDEEDDWSDLLWKNRLIPVCLWPGYRRIIAQKLYSFEEDGTTEESIASRLEEDPELVAIAEVPAVRIRVVGGQELAEPEHTSPDWSIPLGLLLPDYPVHGTGDARLLQRTRGADEFGFHPSSGRTLLAALLRAMAGGVMLVGGDKDEAAPWPPWTPHLGYWRRPAKGAGDIVAPAEAERSTAVRAPNHTWYKLSTLSKLGRLYKGSDGKTVYDLRPGTPFQGNDSGKRIKPLTAAHQLQDVDLVYVELSGWAAAWDLGFDPQLQRYLDERIRLIYGFSNLSAAPEAIQSVRKGEYLAAGVGVVGFLIPVVGGKVAKLTLKARKALLLRRRSRNTLQKILERKLHRTVPLDKVEDTVKSLSKTELDDVVGKTLQSRAAHKMSNQVKGRIGEMTMHFYNKYNGMRRCAIGGQTWRPLSRGFDGVFFRLGPATIGKLPPNLIDSPRQLVKHPAVRQFWDEVGKADLAALKKLVKEGKLAVVIGEAKVNTASLAPRVRYVRSGEKIVKQKFKQMDDIWIRETVRNQLRGKKGLDGQVGDLVEFAHESGGLQGRVFRTTIEQTAEGARIVRRATVEKIAYSPSKLPRWYTDAIASSKKTKKAPFATEKEYAEFLKGK